MIVKNVKYSTKNIEPISAAVGAMYIALGAVFLQSGVKNFVNGLGFRGRFGK